MDLTGKRRKLGIIVPGTYRVREFNYIFQRMKGLAYFGLDFRGTYPYWTMNTEEKAEQEVRFNYIVLKRFRIGCIKIYPTLLLHLLRQRPDIIIVWEAGFEAIIAVIYRVLKGAKLIFGTDMTPFISKKHKGKIFIRKWLFRKGLAFIASSQASWKHLKSLGIDERRIFTAPLTCNVSKWLKVTNRLSGGRSKIQEKLGLNKYRYVILYVGQLSSRKGLFYLLRAFHLLSKKMGDLCLLIVGDGPEKKRLLEYCEKNNLKEKVIFRGFVQPTNILPYFVISDLFVFPSLEDTFGIVVSEALASGLPVICSPFAGASKFIKEGYSGYVVDPTDIEKLSSFMKLILSDQKLRKALGQNARISIQAYTPEKSAEKFLKAIYYV